MRLLKFFLQSSTIMTLIGAILSMAHADDWAVDRGSAYTKDSKSLSVGLSAIPVGLSFAYDYGFHPAISGGGATGAIMSPDVYVPMIARAAFHPFNLKAWAVDRGLREKLDIFGGLASGFELGANAPFPFIIREYIGARFYFAPKFAAFMEDCAGFLNMGVTIKM
jgi:hypothetical protein